MATGRLAVLSNVNMNMVIRMLQKQAEVYDAEGYGNELGALLNPASSYHAFQPDITFLIMDLAELLEHDYDPQTAKERIGNWFQTLEGCLPEHGVFYVSEITPEEITTSVNRDELHGDNSPEQNLAEYLAEKEKSPEDAQRIIERCTAAADGETFQCADISLSLDHRASGRGEGVFPENVVYGKSIAGDGDPVSSGGKNITAGGTGGTHP